MYKFFSFHLRDYYHPNIFFHFRNLDPYYIQVTNIYNLIFWFISKIGFIDLLPQSILVGKFSVLKKDFKPLYLNHFKARKMKNNAFGPLPCDTSFIRAYKNKEYNCLVGMYHDAIQSGLKSFGFEKGVTVQGGLPIPITTPAHGTAFDIVGKNKANVSPMLESLKLLLKLLS